MESVLIPRSSLVSLCEAGRSLSRGAQNVFSDNGNAGSIRRRLPAANSLGAPTPGPSAPPCSLTPSNVFRDRQVVYFVPAALTLLVGLNPSITDNLVWRTLCDLHSAGCIVGTILLAYSLFAYARTNILHEEEGRELSGLLIITIWMSLCRSSAKNPLGGIHLIAAVLVSFFPFVMWLYIYMNKEMRASWPTHCKTVV
nr:PREDICTED: transmembrane protein 220 [Apteryx mantelli mantelli]